MPQLGIMIEAQQGVTWELWLRLIDRVEELGFESLWRSDHVNANQTDLDSLALWPSLTVVATRSRRLRFGPLVPPVTFWHPVTLARDAAAVDRLSEGRLVMGIGAGWNEREHNAFGYPFPSVGRRMDMLEEAIQVMRLLWSGEKVSFDGKYYRLDEAQARPTPVRGAKLPLVVGGSGEKRLLRIVATYADEWNFVGRTPEVYQAKIDVLAQHCAAIGRDPATIKRSRMGPYLVGRDRSDLLRRAARFQQRMPDANPLKAIPVEEVPVRLRETGWLVGEPAELIGQIKAWEALGVERLMLQMLDHEDFEALELIAREVLPAVSAAV